MRILVISDIHANLTALETVLDDAADYEAVWCLGDLVGYGPDPNECIQRVIELPGLLCIIGNHDAAALGYIETMSFNPEARVALEWTKMMLVEENINFLKNLPETIQNGDVYLAHGSPRQPVWEYLMDAPTATLSFAHFSTPYCFVGHTHQPVSFIMEPGQTRSQIITLTPNQSNPLIPRTIINPGSVGQPRDNDPRAAYAIFDSEACTWEYRRVEYDIPSVQTRMSRENLPIRHILRLEAGW